MEPVQPVAPIITAFVHQMRNMATPELSDQVERLSDSQLRLALKIIENKNDMWGSYQEGADPKMEKELVNIIVILAGGNDENQKPEFSLQSFLQSKEKQAEVREKHITQLINTINRSALQLNQPHIFEEKTTDALLREMMGHELSSDALVAKQLYRELDGLKGKVQIEDTDVEIIKPAKCPSDWDQLVPKEIKDYIGPDYRSIGPAVAIFLTQGIAVDPIKKANETVRDPTLPEATFHVLEYPQFKFMKRNEDVILEVTFQGVLGLLDMETARIAPVKSYKMTQLINLTNPTELVKMIIEPKMI